MNFKVGRFLYLAISFLLGLFFLIVGGIGIALPWSDILQIELVQFIYEDKLILPLFGFGLALIGVSLIMYTWWTTKRHYVLIRSGDHAITLNENVIRHYLNSYWEEQFPKHHIPSDLKIKKNAIQIQADFPFLPYSEQKDFLKKIQEDFNDIFGRVLGYPYEIQLIASFQTEKT